MKCSRDSELPGNVQQRVGAGSGGFLWGRASDSLSWVYEFFCSPSPSRPELCEGFYFNKSKPLFNCHFPDKKGPGDKLTQPSSFIFQDTKAQKQGVTGPRSHTPVTLRPVFFLLGLGEFTWECSLRDLL